MMSTSTLGELFKSLYSAEQIKQIKRMTMIEPERNPAVPVTDRFWIKKTRIYGDKFRVFIFCGCKSYRPESKTKRQRNLKVVRTKLGFLEKKESYYREKDSINEYGRWKSTWTSQLTLQLSCNACSKRVESSDVDIILTNIYLIYGENFNRPSTGV